MSAGGVRLEALTFRIGAFALRPVTLDIRPGEYVALTGPNGSGKSLLIKLLAGLYRAESGRIHLDGVDVTNVPPWARPIGYVPQDGLLFPNRDVAANLSFGLEVRGVPAAERAAEVVRMAGFLGIGHLLGRRPQGLSGGERQRVSLGRALVLKPRVLLLDEPVSAIDESSRDSLCSELRRIQRQLGITAVHVAHNRHEIALVADRVGEIRSGDWQGLRDVERDG